MCDFVGTGGDIDRDIVSEGESLREEGWGRRGNGARENETKRRVSKF